MPKLSARERIILSVDTSKRLDAERLVAVAQKAGASWVKLGLELQTAESWGFCSELAKRHRLDWVADAKLDDIPNTVVGAVRNIANLPHPPVGITMHTSAGHEAMAAAQKAAGTIKMLGVTVLTSISDRECYDMLGPKSDPDHPPTAEEMAAFRQAIVMQRARAAARSGLAGIVCSPLEVGAIKSDAETRNLFAMIPGTRSAGVAHNDQARVATPGAAIQDGADLLVIGRQITQADNPALAFEALVAEIEGTV